MQHPDEGTIHSWLDGALPAEDAAILESHVATCQSCAAAVAEARGFIAASSRILTALDDVPRGVVPAVPQKRRDLRVFWRAAAAMLVVAGGSLVVMREGGPDASIPASTKDSAAAPMVSPAPVEAGGLTSSGNAAAESKAAAVSQPPAVVSRARVGSGSVADERDLSARAERRQAVTEANGVKGGLASGVLTGVAGGRTDANAAVPTSAPTQIAAGMSPAALKVLKVEQNGGSRRTTYEIAPSQTVTLTEQESVATVTTAQGVAQPQVMLRGNSRPAPSREATPAAPPPPAMMDSRTANDSVLVSREEAVAKTAAARPQAGAAFSAALNTISWTETRTGKTLTLTGPLPVDRLLEIRQRIERERAAGR